MSKFSDLHKELLSRSGVIACDHFEGRTVYFDPETQAPYNARTVNTLIKKGLVKASQPCIDPQHPRQWEPVNV